MKTHMLEPRRIPLDDSYDVIVVGGGPAGCTAATAAAREGAKTLLLEATGCLGGMGTSGLVPAWCPFSDREKIIYRGLAERVFAACRAGMPHVSEDALDWVPIDHELLKRVYDDLVTGAGVDVIFNTALAGVETDEAGRVACLILASKAGMTACRAKVCVDCTGDGDLAAWAGAEFQSGDDDAGALQPATHCFVLCNVDEYAFRSGARLHTAHPDSPVHRIHESPKYPHVTDAFCCAPIKGPGVVGFNAGHVWEVDGTDPLSVSRALMVGRRIAAEFRDGLAEFHPAAFAGAFLVATGSLMGIRETRRIAGDYVLTVDDYAARRAFPDEICRNAYSIDVHRSREELRRREEGNVDPEERRPHYAKGESHGIPYRCLTPKGLRNVLVAGRSISCDRAVQGSVRVMPVCLAMGEAAGMAAAHAVEQADPDVHAVDVQRLRRRLREEGAYLPDAAGD